MDNLINNIIHKINNLIEKSNQSIDSVNKKTSEINNNEKDINIDNKEVNKNDSINRPIDSINRPKVWYTHYRSYIVKSVLDPETDMIHEKMIPFNQPSNFRKFLDNYFTNELN